MGFKHVMVDLESMRKKLNSNFLLAFLALVIGAFAPHSAHATFPASTPKYWAQSFVSPGAEFPRPENPMLTADDACERTRGQGEYYFGGYGPVTKAVSGLVCTINSFGWSWGITPPGPVPTARAYTIRVTNECPANSTLSGSTCTCDAGFSENSDHNTCVKNDPAQTETALGPQTPAGAQTCKPIIPATGEKFYNHSDYADTGPHALSLARTYRSRWSVSGAAAFAANPGLGMSWAHNYSDTLQVVANTSATLIQGNGSTSAFA
jgi:hypothetical protein